MTGAVDQPLPAVGAAASKPDALPASGGGIGLRGLVLSVVVAGFAIGSAAMALASLTAFERTLMATVDSRLSEVATEIARHIENGLQAGVALEQQRRLLVVMAEERTQAPELSAIRVVGERGQVLFSTNEAEIGEGVQTGAGQVETLARLAGGDKSAPPWRRLGDTEITFGLPLIGLFGEPVGSVLVTLPKDEVEDQQERFALSLALSAAGITAAGALLTALLLALLPLPATERLRMLRRRLEALYAAVGEPKPSLPPASSDAPPLADSLRRFEAWLGPRLNDLAEREAEVRRLDETA